MVYVKIRKNNLIKTFFYFKKALLCPFTHYNYKSRLILKETKLLIEQVPSNKSSLSLKIILQNTQTLQLLTRITKTESTYLSN